MSDVAYWVYTVFGVGCKMLSTRCTSYGVGFGARVADGRGKSKKGKMSGEGAQLQLQSQRLNTAAERQSVNED